MSKLIYVLSIVLFCCPFCAAIIGHPLPDSVIPLAYGSGWMLIVIYLEKGRRDLLKRTSTRILAEFVLLVAVSEAMLFVGYRCVSQIIYWPIMALVFIITLGWYQSYVKRAEHRK